MLTPDFTDKRPSTVTLTTVYATFQVSGTEHAGSQSAFIYVTTCTTINDRNFCILQFVWRTCNTKWKVIIINIYVLESAFIYDNCFCTTVPDMWVSIYEFCTCNWTIRCHFLMFQIEIQDISYCWKSDTHLMKSPPTLIYNSPSPQCTVCYQKANTQVGRTSQPWFLDHLLELS